MTGPPLAAYLDDLRQEVESALAAALPDRLAPPLIVAAMRYPLMGGGKRLRPCLTLAVAEALSARCGLTVAEARRLARPGACAIELVHTYSLVHDDLPAMDDDTLRRGRPTAHVVFGDGLAVLAGDGLLTQAFALLGGGAIDESTDGQITARRLRAVAVLAEAAGAVGMVGGQTIDLAAAGRVKDTRLDLDDAALEDMHARKTGALMVAAVTLGAVAVGADQTALAAIDQYGRGIGLAFQIIDDLLDVEGSAAALGKTAGKDAAAGKPTYPSRFGLARSRQIAQACVARATAALAPLAPGGRLAEIAAWSLERQR